jgi:NAD-dependent SIR2 family protein deacetylase
MLIVNDSFGPRNMGVLELDNRPAGFRLHEYDTYTCSHCNRVVVMNPERKRERYKCRGCEHHICDECAALRTAGAPCRTITQWFDEIRTQEEKMARADGQAEPSLILPPT